MAPAGDTLGARKEGGTALTDVSTKGAFVRATSGFRSQVGDPGFEAESGRYHLYISHACPWANRCHAVLRMKGLESHIGVSVTHQTWAKTRPGDDSDTHHGWAFADPSGPPMPSPNGSGAFTNEGCVPDTVEGCTYVRDLYDIAGAPPGTRFTVPVLWDKQRRTIVNNESSEILRMLNSGFNHLASNPGLDLYPEHLRAAVDEANAWTYDGINNGVYRCGFATQQGAYDEAEAELFAALDRAEGVLSKQRYIAGDTLTEADVRLFMTLVRFDEVYVVYFKTNRRCIREYPNLSNYTRDVYQQPGVKETINMKHIKEHYFTSHPQLNHYAIVPRGPGTDFDAPHDRGRFSK